MKIEQGEKQKRVKQAGQEQGHGKGTGNKMCKRFQRRNDVNVPRASNCILRKRQRYREKERERGKEGVREGGEQRPRMPE